MTAATNRLSHPKLRLLPTYTQYVGVGRNDPIRFYYWPIIGNMYRRRVELCLAECSGGERILEVGFGSGVTFFNLRDSYKEIYGLDLTASVEQVTALFENKQIQTHLQSGNVLKMPYTDCFFDSVMLISILEHLKPDEQGRAFAEIKRVLKLGGQVVYGVPVERPLMVLMFRLLGYDIHENHFSTEKHVARAAGQSFKKVRIIQMRGPLGLFGAVYEVGHFLKERAAQSLVCPRNGQQY